MKFSRYKDLVSFLFYQLPMYQRVGPKAFKKDLKNIKQLCEFLGNPQNDFKAIHIAGTNGKGSTSFLVATALHAMGYQVGLYTSPHYKDYRERIKLNGEMIPKSFVKRFVNDLVEKNILDGSFKPSFFEITVAMAFSYFSASRLDYAVIETGLGGRLDSTNVVNPVLTAITNISLDHTQFLGNTLAKIAREKAGIIKKSVPVIIGRRQKETAKVFESIARRKSAEMIYAEDNDYPISGKLTLNAPDYQIENMRTASAILDTLINNFDFTILNHAWTKGLRQWNYMGRYQLVQDRPKIVLDSAHNGEGLRLLFEQINKEKFDQLHIVIAVVNDKQLDPLFEILPRTARYYVSEAQIPRALDKGALYGELLKHGFEAKMYNTIPRALAYAKLHAGKNDMVLVTGSIFTVAEVC